MQLEQGSILTTSEVVVPQQDESAVVSKAMAMQIVPEGSVLFTTTDSDGNTLQLRTKDRVTVTYYEKVCTSEPAEHTTVNTYKPLYFM